MREKEIEDYFIWTVAVAGGRAWKFTSPANRGVSDRIACMPDGSTWFVELKRPKGSRLSMAQTAFASEMSRLKQLCVCLSTKEEIDDWLKAVSRRSS